MFLDCHRTVVCALCKHTQQGRRGSDDQKESILYGDIGWRFVLWARKITAVAEARDAVFGRLRADAEETEEVVATGASASGLGN
jgi:hypothetical protein